MKHHVQITFKLESGPITFSGDFEGATVAEARQAAIESYRSRFGDAGELVS